MDNLHLKYLQASKINQDHLSVLYLTRKRKLELALRKNERDDDTNKRKYYSLLVQYEASTTKKKALEDKIEERE